MITATLVFLTVLALLYFSIRERIRLRISRYRSQKLWEIEPRSTPFSQAVVNLIGVAGGIYLSLVIFFTFLEITLPARMRLGDVEVEPLAAVAIGLALLQPFVVQLWAFIRQRFHI